MNYYNENDPKAAAWLRELIKEGHISEGVVDERSILDVLPSDLQGYKQCHFFAGIGGWSYALRLAGVPDDEPVWTGSCPCQPFSVAGQQRGVHDKRHLWPVFFNLIAEHYPSTVFGEQVASKAGRSWLSRVFSDLESVAYAGAGADICAAGVRSPHIRQRLWWVANSVGERRIGEHSLLRQKEPRWNPSNLSEITGSSTIGRLANPDGGLESNSQLQRSRKYGQQSENGSTCGLEHKSNGRQQRWPKSSGRSIISRRSSWDNFDLLPCTDGKTRRIEPGTFPLAHGLPGRVGLLRGYGNAIVPQVAVEFISAFYEAYHDVRSDVLTP